jgi:hypothetical protein
MGCDIHSYAEVRKDGKWEIVGDVFPLNDFDREWRKKTHGCSPFDWRSYGLFGFLADVRNYSHVPVIAQPKFTIPADVSSEVAEMYLGWKGDAHTASWLTLRELMEFDYEQVFWDLRVTKQVSANGWSGAALAEEGEGTHPTIREFLGAAYFRDVEVLKTLGAPDDVRVVFWFDN